MTPVLTQLGNTIMPQVFTALSAAGVVETMSVSRSAATRGAMGGSTANGTTTTPYTSVPVSVEVDKKGGRIDAQGKPIALQTYILEFPVLTSAGVLITIDLATDKLIVDARSPIPARTYKIECPADDTMVINRYVCTQES
jgi:hypothetical protein